MTEDAKAKEFFARLRSQLRRSPAKTLDAPGLQLREAAVLAPLFWREGEPWVYLTRRPMTLRQHPGQISFPGGGREPGDVTALHTALREAQEELGIAPDQVEVLGMLGSMPTVTSFWVTPFVGVVPPELQVSPHPGEIEEVLLAPLWQLRAEKREIYHAPRDVLVWGDARHVVWGATHRMLSQLLEQMRAIGH